MLKPAVFDDSSVGCAALLATSITWDGNCRVARACAGAQRVFHLAARADIVPSIQEPEAYFRANVDGTFNVLEAARAQHIERFVYVASSSCYGIPTTYPTPETSPPDPRYPYA